MGQMNQDAGKRPHHSNRTDIASKTHRAEKIARFPRFPNLSLLNKGRRSIQP